MTFQKWPNLVTLWLVSFDPRFVLAETRRKKKIFSIFVWSIILAGMCCCQCDQIVWFLKLLFSKFSLKRSPNIWWLFGLLEIHQILCKMSVATFVKFGLLFIPSGQTGLTGHTGHTVHTDHTCHTGHSGHTGQTGHKVKLVIRSIWSHWSIWSYWSHWSHWSHWSYWLLLKIKLNEEATRERFQAKNIPINLTKQFWGQNGLETVSRMRPM